MKAVHIESFHIVNFFKALAEQDRVAAKAMLDARPELVNRAGYHSGWHRAHGPDYSGVAELPLVALFSSQNRIESKDVHAGLRFVRGNAEMVRLLLRYQPDFAGVYHDAHLVGHAIAFLPEVAKDFVDAGLSPMQTMPRGTERVGLYQQIAESQHPEIAVAIADLAARGVEFYFPDSEGNEALNAILSNHAQPTFVVGQTSLTTIDGLPLKVEALLRAGANPNRRNGAGYNAFDVVVGNSGLGGSSPRKVMEILIRSGANLEHPLVLQNQLPMDYLFQKNMAAQGHTSYIASLCRDIEHAEGPAALRALVLHPDGTPTETCFRLLGSGLLQELFHTDKWQGHEAEGRSLARDIVKSLPPWVDPNLIDCTQLAAETLDGFRYTDLVQGRKNEIKNRER